MDFLICRIFAALNNGGGSVLHKDNAVAWEGFCQISLFVVDNMIKRVLQLEHKALLSI